MPLLRFSLMLSLLLSSISFGQANLQIIRATYGDGNTVRDVTATVQATVQNNAVLRVQAMPDSLGGDPVPGNLKTLWIQYNYNGQAGEISAQDGAWIRGLFRPLDQCAVQCRGPLFRAHGGVAVCGVERPPAGAHGRPQEF